MSSISSADNNVHIAHDRKQKTTAKESAQVTTKIETNGTNVNSGSNRVGEVELSTRAQKIQKLNEDFFPAGPQSLKITSAFIDRLKEYGFLSDNEAKELHSSTTLDKESSTPNLEKLSLFIDRFNDQIQKEDPENSLISTLDNAKNILNNLDKSRPSSKATDIKAVIAELMQYKNSEAAQELSHNDKASLNQLEAALRISDKLNPGNLSSQKVSHYLSVLNQSL